MQAIDFMMYGLVLALCGSILNLVSIASPNWRTIHNITGEDPHLVLQQGLWDVCWDIMKKGEHELICTKDYKEYLENRVVVIAQWMMVVSIPVTLIGLAVAIVSHFLMARLRCVVSSFGGLLIACSGVLVIISAAWYAHIFTDLPSPSTYMHLGHSVVLACIGGSMNVISGCAMFVGNCVSCCRSRHEKRCKSSTSQLTLYLKTFHRVSMENNATNGIDEHDNAL